MAILLSSEIHDICWRILQDIKTQYPYYYPHVFFMYHYGCRIGEVFNYRISLDSSGNNISIDAQKNNNQRILPAKDSDTFYQLEKLQLSQNNTWLNKKNLERVIKKVHPIRDLKIGNKNVGAHLFRHNYVKKLVADGLQFTTIDQIMGYTTQSVSDTYAVSKIYY